MGWTELKPKGLVSFLISLVCLFSSKTAAGFFSVNYKVSKLSFSVSVAALAPLSSLPPLSPSHSLDELAIAPQPHVFFVLFVSLFVSVSRKRTRRKNTVLIFTFTPATRYRIMPATETSPLLAGSSTQVTTSDAAYLHAAESAIESAFHGDPNASAFAVPNSGAAAADEESVPEGVLITEPPLRADLFIVLGGMWIVRLLLLLYQAALKG